MNYFEKIPDILNFRCFSDVSEKILDVFENKHT